MTFAPCMAMLRSATREGQLRLRLGFCVQLALGLGLGLGLRLANLRLDF